MAMIRETKDTGSQEVAATNSMAVRDLAAPAPKVLKVKVVTEEEVTIRDTPDLRDPQDKRSTLIQISASIMRKIKDFMSSFSRLKNLPQRPTNSSSSYSKILSLRQLKKDQWFLSLQTSTTPRLQQS